jgi:hypothetical protein
MKKLSVIFATILSLAFTTTSFAKGNASLNAASGESRSKSFNVGMYTSLKNELVVLLKKEDSNDVKVSITDENGNRVFAEKIKSDGSVIKRYNLSKLAKGSYFVKFTRPNEVFSREFTIN